jgi:hypothetical protein
MLAAKITRIQELQELEAPRSERPAEPGELCTCGRQAVVVYFGSEWGPTGACLIQDGGSRQGPCPWCGDPRPPRDAYGGRCPQYRLRLDD